jgi:hypothetical protein
MCEQVTGREEIAQATSIKRAASRKQRRSAFSLAASPSSAGKNAEGKGGGMGAGLSGRGTPMWIVAVKILPLRKTIPSTPDGRGASVGGAVRSGTIRWRAKGFAACISNDTEEVERMAVLPIMPERLQQAGVGRLAVGRCLMKRGLQEFFDLALMCWNRFQTLLSSY